VIFFALAFIAAVFIALDRVWPGPPSFPVS
jgi:hypothetical protein